MFNNYNYSKETAIRIPVNTVEIFHAGEEYWYSHSPFLAYFKDQFVVMWLVNKLHEEEDGQDILLTYSKDFLHWTKPVKFPVDDKYRTEGLIHPGGFLVNGDELNLYFSYYEWTDNTVTGSERKDFSHKNTKMFCITTKDLVNFSEPIDMNLDMQMVLPPQRTSTGKLIGGGMFTFPWTDDPNGIHGFKKAGYLPEEVYENYPDHSQSFYEVGKYVGLEVHLMEASLMDYGDGRLKMLLRSRDNRNFVQLENELYTREVGDNLYASDSTDGVHWSPIYRTDFTNNDSKFNAGRLSDGRFYIVSNPNRLGLRLPLAISLSEDGETFDKHYIIREDFNNIRNMGRWKQYGCQYPYTMEHDGWLYVVYSVCKEDVHISRISLQDLK